jgi:hypothetical protein
MKRLFLVFLFVGIAVVYFGCSVNDPSAPELNQSDQVTVSLEKKVVTTFTGTSSNTQVVEPPKITTLPDGRELWRGFVVTTDDNMSDDRVTGTVTWVVHLNIYPDGSDKRWGTGELIIPDRGRWQMPYKGWKTVDGVVTYEVDGHGKGEFRGLKAHWTYVLDLSQGIFVVDGFIIEK